MPTGGEIYINGVPAASFIRNEYYRLFSPVFQDVRTAFFSLAETVSCRPEKETDFKLAEKCMRLAGLGGKIDSCPLEYVPGLISNSIKMEPNCPVEKLIS